MVIYEPTLEEETQVDTMYATILPVSDGLSDYNDRITLCYMPVFQETKRELVWSVVEVPPMFPGGETNLMNFIKESLKYPDDALGVGIEGQVIVRFFIDSQGYVTDPEIIRSLYSSCDDEAIRVVNQMPRWLPGRQNGNFVKASFLLPITFKLN